MEKLIQPRLSYLCPLPIKKYYVERKIAKHEKKSKAISKLGIWSQLKIETSLPGYNWQSDESKEQKLPMHQSVYFFHSEDSRQRKSELDTFYNLYVPEIHVEKRFKLLLTDETIKYYNIMELVGLYNNFDIPSSDQNHMYNLNWEIMKQSVKRNLEKKEENDWLLPNFLPTFRPFKFFDEQMRPLSLYECENLSNKSFLKIGIGDCTSNWLRLMSWWKDVNDHLPISELCVYQQLKAAKDHPDLYNEDELAESVEILEDLLESLGMSHGIAELSALHHYIQFDTYIPDSSTWLPTSKHDTLFNNIADDTKLVAFMSACGYQSIQITFDVMSALDKTKESDLIKETEMVFKTCIKHFYYDVIQSLQIEVSYSDFVPPTLGKLNDNFRQLFREMRTIGHQEEFIKYPLQIATNILIRKVCTLADIITNSQHIKSFFGEDNTMQIAQFILKFITAVAENAIFIVYKVFQKDFITNDLLLEICNKDSNIPCAYLFDINCIKVAYCILVTYKFMYKRSTFPENCFNLASDYRWQDFRTFLDEIGIFSDQGITRVQSTFQDATLKLQTIQKKMCCELMEELKDITFLAKCSNEILQAAKYF